MNDDAPAGERIRRLYIGDNAPILRCMESESADLIYLDPPFNSKKQWSAPIGSAAEGAEFKDTWTRTDIKDDELRVLKNRDEIREAGGLTRLTDLIKIGGAINGESWEAYLTFMAVRLSEMHRILKPTGSLYFHCDPTMSHGVKLLLDAIFGGENFISEIIWNYGTPSGGRVAGKKPVKSHENLLAYARCFGRHTYHPQFLPYNEKYVRDWFRHTDEDGRKYRTRTRKGEIVRQYLDESKGVPLSNVWTDIMQLYGSAGWFPRKNDERTGYPTQKPVALLERIIKASSNPGDVVLDPFCGCATTCVAAAEQGRSFIGIDVSQTAAGIMGKRMTGQQHLIADWQKCEVMHVVNASRVFPKRADVKREERAVKGEQHRKMLYEKQHGRCAGCREDEKLKNLENDRIVAGAMGGHYTRDNVQLLCGRCNGKKRDRTMNELRAALKEEYVREKTREARAEFERLHLDDGD